MSETTSGPRREDDGVTSSRCCRLRYCSAVLFWITLASIVATDNAFSIDSDDSPSSFASRRNVLSQKKLTSRMQTDPIGRANKMSIVDISEFYQSYPLQSAILTCGVRALVADSIAQLHQTWTESNHHTVELRRSLAYVMYGGVFVGLMSHLEYDLFFPWLFGTDHSASTVAMEVVLDDFICAPLVWLPPAYLIKALVFRYPLEDGLRRYFRDIQDQGLLWKYWSVWVPTQTISFSVIPDHFRVAFMAAISFFWFLLFSALSSRKIGVSGTTYTS